MVRNALIVLFGVLSVVGSVACARQAIEQREQATPTGEGTAEGHNTPNETLAPTPAMQSTRPAAQAANANESYYIAEAEALLEDLDQQAAAVQANQATQADWEGWSDEWNRSREVLHRECRNQQQREAFVCAPLAELVGLWSAWNDRLFHDGGMGGVERAREDVLYFMELARRS